MADDTVHERSDTLEGVLWEALENRGLGFLGLTKSGLHPQPVVVFVDRRRRRLWLAACADSELVRSIGDGGSAMVTVDGPGLMASVGGSVSVEEDARRLARLWTGQAQAWRPEGPHDPALCLLRMDCLDAELSLAEVGLRKFSWDLGRRAIGRQPGPVIASPQPTLH